ncbi:hypothetical protein PLICRDRAFT_179240 [Plicaturopsis crispa FD-325 SS-3]|uniref:Protein MON2 homolog n=1 Tax=Plicaturopsis crispa FD-325 SS-3 TaxID=944288 RepID=A0A0C9T6E9_PLICR|nr:hypothetical protein PLICRDRAFT_179240 [Plicaturopsis crispa FD-325 SS-3]
MSSLAFLVTELQALASETRRKHPEIRDAAEKSLAILRASPEQATAKLAADGPQSEDLLRPVFMGCATRNAKVVGISLGSLQRLIALKAVPHSAVSVIISTMSDAMSQGVDIQLRILQTLLSLITNFPAVHGTLLGDALLLCFKLQESRIAVVSSTAAATLRQLVMFVVDKVVEEDQQDDIPPERLSETTLPDGTTISLGPSARDAFSIFEDLCLLANSEKPHFLKLDFLHKTFALELIESVLTNYHDLFRRHSELLMLLQHHLCPLLLKALSDRPNFPLTLRCTRVVFILLKQFSYELKTEAEVFLVLLIKIIGDDLDSGAGSHANDTSTAHGHGGNRPQLCIDAEFVRNIWDRYDSEQESGSKVFTSLITALKRLVTEKPALLGVSTQIFGVGVTAHASEGQSASSSAYSLDVGSMAGMVATAASATMSGVVGYMGSSGGLSLQGSAMKLQCIDQLDKADSPPIPESYLQLLGVQCLVSLCEGFASFTGPVYSAIVIQKPRAAGDAPIRAPPALDISSLPPDDATTKQLRIVRDMIESGWPALLAALSFIVSTNLSDELFVDVLGSYQAMTNVSGMLALTTPRDAFFLSLAKYAIPTGVVSSLDSYAEPSTPRTATSISEGLGLSGPAQAPGLSERNMACLKVLVSSALFLAGSLGESWFGILEALQNAEYVLNSRGAQPAKRMPTSGSGGIPSARSVSSTGANTQGGMSASHGAAGAQGQTQRHPLLSDLDPESVQNAIQRLFDASKNMEDSAFKDFINALCRLSGEMVGMQLDGTLIVDSDSADDVVGLSPRTENAHRRRVSGIHLPRTLRSGDFGINKLGGVALLNIHRLIYRSPEVAWNTTTAHLLSVIRLAHAPQSIRIQAARVLDEILTIVPRNLTTAHELQPKVQRRVLDVLAKQVIPDGNPSGATPTSAELRRMGLETLHQILQASGHTLVVGWETIFEMLGSVCKPAPTPKSSSMETGLDSSSSIASSRPKPLPLGYTNEKSYTTLVKIAFQSLTLVCDSVSTLSSEHLRLCISTLGQFGRQADTNIALTAAESLLWSVSDSIQAKRKDVDKEPEYSALWMFLLLEVLGLCTDARPEVRMGAIQTLFRTMQLYGATLSLDTWDECIWKVTFPLIESITLEIRHHASTSPTPVPVDPLDNSPAKAWDDSKTLALQSFGSILHDFLTSKIMKLESFSRAWDVFVNHIQESVLLDNRTISTPALRCLEKALKASASADPDLKEKVAESWQRAWRACDEMGEAVVRRASSQSVQSSHPTPPFTQECLVAFVDVIRGTRAVSRILDGTEWQIDRLTRVVTILKGVLTYPNSPDYRPDIDALTPVQSVVMEAIAGIDLSSPGSPSLVIRDLSEYATLPFLAAFDVPSFAPPPTNDSPVKAQQNRVQKRITYIGLAKKTMPLLVDLFMQFRHKAEIYTDGTLEAVLSAYSIPIKLKYDCPAPSKFGKDLPLWKTATTNFLKIVKEAASQLKTLDTDIPDDRIEGIWRQVIDVFRGGILADCSAVENMSLEEQESEENFDLALIASLEIDVIPHMGDPRVPDNLVIQLAKVLHQGSRLFESFIGPEGASPSPSPVSPKLDGQRSKHSSNDSSDFEKVDIEKIREIGRTESGPLAPRERFSYWCFDLLFLTCSDITKDQEESRRRIAALSLPSLLNRCQNTLVGYVADESLRGNLPFPRAREDELLYVLRKLLELRLWPGTLWAALSESPSSYCAEQPAIGTDLAPSALIADAVKRSSVAHLFHFYSILCEIASIPRKTPSTWVLTESPLPLSIDGGKGSVGGAIELDARVLARGCLKAIGKELGDGR